MKISKKHKGLFFQIKYPDFKKIALWSENQRLEMLTFLNIIKKDFDAFFEKTQSELSVFSETRAASKNKNDGLASLPTPRQTITSPTELLSFGKYKGKSVNYIYTHDSSYLAWAIDNGALKTPSDIWDICTEITNENTVDNKDDLPF